MPCSQGVANALNERDTRVSQSENIKGGEGGGGGGGDKGGNESVSDTARVTRPSFVHFMGLTLRYDYSRGCWVLLPSLASDAPHASRTDLT